MSDVKLPPLDVECEDCQGTGVWHSEEWLDWHNTEAAMREQFQRDPRNAGKDWYASEEYAQLKAKQPREDDGTPIPETDICVECDGRGRRTTDAGYQVLKFLGRRGVKVR